MPTIRKTKHGFYLEFPDREATIEFGPDLPLFSLSVGGSPGSPNKTMTAGDFPDPRVLNDPEGVRLSYPTTEGIKVEVTLLEDSNEVTGQISVESADGKEIVEVRFPAITWTQVNECDELIFATAWGDAIQKPRRTITEAAAADHPLPNEYVKREDGELRYRYPSVLSMQQVTLSNPSQSVLLARYGESDESFDLNAGVPDEGIRLSASHYPFSDRWESPECGIAVVEGDWHSATDHYVERTGDSFGDPDLPEWMEESFHGWMAVRLREEGKEPEYRFEDLPECYEVATDLGVEVLQVSGWCNNGFDTMYPDYKIDPQLGTAADLREAIQEINDMGGRVILYTNARLVDPDSMFSAQYGEAPLVRDANGETLVETYGTSPDFEVACPGSPDYRSYFADQIENAVSELGANALQFDQISCNYQPLCFSDDHDHDRPSTAFPHWVDQLLKNTRERYRAADPETFTWIEGCHERYGQYYDVEQGHGEEFTWAVGRSLPEQFLYAYPNRFVTGMWNSYHQACHTVAQGKPVHGVRKHIEEDARLESLLRDYMALRKTWPEYYIRGRFQDSVGLDVAGNVRAFAIERADGDGLLVTVWQPGANPNEDCSAALKRPRDTPAEIAYPTDLDLYGEKWLELSWCGPLASIVFE